LKPLEEEKADITESSDMEILDLSSPDKIAVIEKRN